MKNKKIHTQTKAIILVIFSLSLFFNSCTEKIDLDLDSTYVRLVVEGAITSDTTSHFVKLTKTSDYFSDQKALTISGAIVTINDGTTIIPLSETVSGSGIYATAPDVYAISGKTYTLNIELQEEISGTKHYTAISDMKPVSTIDSIAIKYNEVWKGWIVQCYALDPPTTEFYMFNIYKNGIHLTDTINKVMVVDDRLFNGSYTNGIGVAFLDEENPREVIHPFDKITLQMGSLTEGYTDFIWQVQEETEYQTPLFSGPPANIKGNISDGAIGYFAAYSTSYASVVAK